MRLCRGGVVNRAEAGPSMSPTKRANPRALLVVLLLATVPLATTATAMPYGCYLLCPPDPPPVVVSSFAFTTLRSLQGDGGGSGDASNSCVFPNPVRSTPVSTSGMIGRGAGDPSDNYDLRISATALPNVRVTVTAQTPAGLNVPLYHDLDVYVRAAPSATACGAVLVSNTGTSTSKVVTFAKGAATRFVVEIVDNGLHVRGVVAAVCGGNVCLDDPRLVELHTMCYPACSTVNAYAGYLFRAESVA